MSKHTPGPWIVGMSPPNGEQTIGTQQGLMVAVATTGAGTPTEANAALIAAAPDMWEACIAIANGYKHKGEELALAAIAKVKGEKT